jgi:hypothetical protein
MSTPDRAKFFVVHALGTREHLQEKLRLNVDRSLELEIK